MCAICFQGNGDSDLRHSIDFAEERDGRLPFNLLNYITTVLSVEEEEQRTQRQRQTAGQRPLHIKHMCTVVHDNNIHYHCIACLLGGGVARVGVDVGCMM